jgi:hypothetical protein
MMAIKNLSNTGDWNELVDIFCETIISTIKDGEILQEYMTSFYKF